MIEIVTIGVYGFDEAGFFAALQAAGVDTFCDLRARRGVRGVDYAFANSQRLQKTLSSMGIHYVHYPELAPSQTLRNRQWAADIESKTTKRQRTHLSHEFVTAYREEALTSFDSARFLAGMGVESSIGAGKRILALFCVERDPAACHRSLVADHLAQDLHIRVTHLMPPPPR